MQKETLLTSSFLFILSSNLSYIRKGMQFYLVLAEVPGIARGILKKWNIEKKFKCIFTYVTPWVPMSFLNKGIKS